MYFAGYADIILWLIYLVWSISKLLIVGLPLQNNILGIFGVMSHERIDAVRRIGLEFFVHWLFVLEVHQRLDWDSSGSFVHLHDFLELKDLLIHLN